MFAFVSWQSDHFWPRCSELYTWPWIFKVKVTAKVKSYGHIWGLEYNWYVCFLFRANLTIFGRDIANSIFDLENSDHGQGQIWWSHLRLGVQSICLLFVSWNIFGQKKANSIFGLHRSINPTKQERNLKSCSEVIAWTRLCGRQQHRRTNRYKNIKSPLVYRGDLIRWSYDHLTFIMGIPRPGKIVFILKQGPSTGIIHRLAVLTVHGGSPPCLCNLRRTWVADNHLPRLVRWTGQKPGDTKYSVDIKVNFFVVHLYIEKELCTQTNHCCV